MLIPLLSLLCAARSIIAASAPQNYVNTAITRNIELGGAVTTYSTQYNVKATTDNPGDYWLALASPSDAAPAWWSVEVGGTALPALSLLDGAAVDGSSTIRVPLGKLSKGDTATFSLSHDVVHASVPLPAELEQRDPQFLLWKTNATYVESWYPSDVERIKIRSPTPNILSHGNVPSEYTRDNTVTKSSSTLTLGPFHSVPPTLGSSGKVAQQSPFEVHFETRDPVMGFSKLVRTAEVSHWGGNINIQDEINLVNQGPKLKGHFSRLAHQQSRFHASVPAQILSELTLRLPPNSHDVYYYDTIGNVSTSKFRPGSTSAVSNKKSRTAPRNVDATLELKPRYPILGGWNYSFTIGYDNPLGDFLKVDGEKKVLAVPFLTGWRDLVVDDAEVRIILPEGARNVEIATPFPIDTITHSTHKTYLDSTGRHQITLRKAHCTTNHAQNIYVTYEYPNSALLQKPLTVAAVVMGLFILGSALRRVEWSIEAKKVI